MNVGRDLADTHDRRGNAGVTPHPSPEVDGKRISAGIGEFTQTVLDRRADALDGDWGQSIWSSDSDIQLETSQPLPNGS